MSLVFAMTMQTRFLISDAKIQKTNTQFQLTTRHHPCMANLSIHERLLQCWYNGVAQTTITNQALQDTPSVASTTL